MCIVVIHSGLLLFRSLCWAFSFHVLVDGLGSTTDIYKADETGITGFMMDTGRAIVGAGVSTCAPVVDIE